MIRHPHNFALRRRSRYRGFTLIEAALTTMIVGVGLVAMLQLLAAGTTANIEGAQTTTGVNLARNIRELTLTLPFDEIRALNGTTFSPPIDSRGATIDDFNEWTQTVQVQSVSRDRVITDTIEVLPHVVRVTVTVSQNGQEACNLSWYRFKPMP